MHPRAPKATIGVALALAFLLGFAPPWGALGAPQPQSIEPLALSLRYTYRSMDGLQTNVVFPAPTYDHLHDVAWAPDGHMALAVGSHNAMLGWDNATQTTRLLRNGTLGNLYGVAWSADSSTALAVGWNGSLVRYSSAGIEDLAPQGTDVWQGATWFPGKGFLVVGTGGSAFFLDVDVRTNIPTPTTYDLMAVAFNGVSGKALAVGRAGAAVEIDALGAATNVTTPTVEDLRAVGFESDTGVGHIAGGVSVLLTYQAGAVTNETAAADGGFYDLSVTRSAEPTVVAIRNASTGFGSLLFTNGSFSNWVALGAGFTGVEAVARSPTAGYVLATGFFGVFVIAWDNGTWSSVSQTMRASLVDASWRPTGDYALIAGFNGTLLLYNKTANATAYVPLPNYNVSLRSVSWAANGSEALVVGLNVFWRFDFATGAVTAPAGNVSLDLYGVAFRPNATEAVAVGAGGFIGRWDGANLTRVSGTLTQAFFSVTWHKDASGTGDYAYAGGANLVAKYDPPGLVTTVTRIGTFFGVAFLGDDVWIAGDPHQLHKYDSSVGIWDNVTMPAELNTIHFSKLAATPSGDRLMLVGNQSFTAFVNSSDLRRFDTGFLALFNSVAYNPATGDPLFTGSFGLAFEMRETMFPNLAPTAVISQPANGTNWTTADRVLFDARASSDPDGDTLTYAWSDDLTGFITTAASFDIPLGSGNHTITLVVNDGHGHNASASVLVRVVEAQYPPIAVMASPAAGSNYTDDDDITFSALGSSDTNVNDTLSYEWTSSLTGLIGTDKVEVTKLSQGPHTVTLKVTDSTGRSTNVTRLVNVAQGDIPPSITIASPLPSSLYAANVPIVFDARNTTDPDSPSFTLIWSLDTFEIGRGPLFNRTVAQGTHTLLLVADDGRKTSQVTFSFAVGPPVNLRPKFLSYAPANGSTLTGTVVFTGSMEADPVGPVLFVEIRFELGDWQRAAGASTWSLAVDSTLLPNGRTNATLRASDGQYIAEVALVFTVDNPFINQRPTVAVLAPRPAASVRGLLTAAGSSDDPDGNVTSVEYRVNAGIWANATVEGGSWTATIDTASFANGPITIEVRAFDGYNYSDVSAVTVIVDNPPAGGGLLPGLGAIAVSLAVGAAALLAGARRRRDRR